MNPHCVKSPTGYHQFVWEKRYDKKKWCGPGEVPEAIDNRSRCIHCDYIETGLASSIRHLEEEAQMILLGRKDI